MTAATFGMATSAASAERLTALIVDDEPVARRQLRALLAAHPDVTVVGEADDGRRAIEAVGALRPSLVLLDVEIPEATGVEVAAALGRSPSAGGAGAPAVVFTTAYERYAVAAFEVAAVDYLLKPFGARRLAAALDRVRAHVRAARGVGVPAPGARAPTAFGEPGAFGTPPEHPPSGHLLVRAGRQLVPVAAADIVRLEADDDYVHVHAAGARHLVTARLGSLVAQCAPWPFLRVHRSHAVNLAHVVALVPRPDARLEVRLRDGARVVASRAGSRLLRAWDARRGGR